jgi:glycosyltransferase involved in cell wall biosynthesis
MRESISEVDDKLSRLPSVPKPRAGSFSLSCVVPVFNEQEVIESFLRELKPTLAAITPRYEIIVVNDGSRDNTADILVRIGQELGITLLDLSRNFGKEAAMTAGLAQARGDAVVLIDADFQEPLDSIEPMVEQWRAGYDMVYAVRDTRAEEGWLKRAGARLFYALLAGGANIEIPADARDFRVMDRLVVDALNELPERNRFMKGLFAWVGFRSTAVSIRVARRAAGSTSFRLRQLRRLAWTGVTAFSNLPLRIWGALGVLVALFAFGWGAWILFERMFLGQPIAGFATLAASIMFFSGIQLISIGIIGEYLGRVYDEVKGRPSYIIARREEHGALPERARHER